MPFVSEAQRAFMYANHPDIAKRWSRVTPKGKKLPEHVHKHEEKKAMDPMQAFRDGLRDEFNKVSSVLTATGRKHIKKKNFALPGGRYPVHDAAHARAALSRVAQHGTSAEQAAVRAKVHAKYPNIGKQEKTAMSDPAQIFRQGFAAELGDLGLAKVAKEHSEPFIDDSTRGVAQEHQQEYGHGKGMKAKDGAGGCSHTKDGSWCGRCKPGAGGKAAVMKLLASAGRP